MGRVRPWPPLGAFVPGPQRIPISTPATEKRMRRMTKMIPLKKTTRTAKSTTKTRMRKPRMRSERNDHISGKGKEGPQDGKGPRPPGKVRTNQAPF